MLDMSEFIIRITITYIININDTIKNTLVCI